MKVVEGIYDNGQIILDKKVVSDTKVRVAVVFEGDVQIEKKEARKLSVSALPKYELEMENPGELFRREDLY